MLFDISYFRFNSGKITNPFKSVISREKPGKGVVFAHFSEYRFCTEVLSARVLGHLDVISPIPFKKPPPFGPFWS